MWFPLAFQVQYLDLYTCFIALRVVCREFLYPQITMFDIMSFKLVHSIKNSLNAKRSLHLRVNFIFLCILVINMQQSKMSRHAAFVVSLIVVKLSVL